MAAGGGGGMGEAGWGAAGCFYYCEGRDRRDHGAGHGRHQSSPLVRGATLGKETRGPVLVLHTAGGCWGGGWAGLGFSLAPTRQGHLWSIRLIIL